MLTDFVEWLRRDKQKSNYIEKRRKSRTRKRRKRKKKIE